MKTITVELEERSYAIYLERGGLDALGKLYERLELGERAAIVTDRTVEKLHGTRALDALKGAGIDAQLVSVPPGEASKSLRWADRLYTRLIWAGFDRGSTIVALGGGVVGDLAGFVAATYLRGIDWVCVPTTLLAQVDAAVGGKTGINHRLGKNLIGAFHQPRAVLIDPELLATLSDRELQNGLAEVVKYGLIYDAEFFAQLETELKTAAVLKDIGALTPLIARSVRIKSEIVSRDERERDERALLNFGHTLGHGLEATTNYGHFLHGEAVVWGMCGESWISRERNWLTREAFERIAAVLARFDVPALPEGLEIGPLLAYISRDKKTRRRQLRCVLLQAPGQAVLCEVTEEEIRGALNHLRAV